MFRKKPRQPPSLKIPDIGAESPGEDWPSLESPTFCQASDDENTPDFDHTSMKSQFQGIHEGSKDGSNGPAAARRDRQGRRSTPVLPKLKLGKLATMEREPLQQVRLPINQSMANGEETDHVRLDQQEHGPVHPLTHTYQGGRAPAGGRKENQSTGRPPSGAPKSQGSASASAGRVQKPVNLPKLALAQIGAGEGEATGDAASSGVHVAKTSRGLWLGRLLTPRGRSHADDGDAAAIERRRPSTSRAAVPSLSIQRSQSDHSQQQQARLNLQQNGTPRGSGLTAIASFRRLLTPRGGAGQRRRKDALSCADSVSCAPREAQEREPLKNAAARADAMLHEAASAAIKAMQSSDFTVQLQGTSELTALVQDSKGCEAASSLGAVSVLAAMVCAAEKGPRETLHPAAVPALEALVLLLGWSSDNKAALRTWRCNRMHDVASETLQSASATVSPSQTISEALQSLIRMAEPMGPSPCPPAAQYLALLAVRVMTEQETDRQAVHAAGAVPVLLSILADQSAQKGLQENAAGALGNLSAGAGNLKAALRRSGAIPALVRLLKSDDLEKEGSISGNGAVLAEFASGALMNMSLKNLRNRQMILDAGGLEPLLKHLSAGQKVLQESFDCRAQMTDGSLSPATMSFDLAQGHILVTPHPRSRPHRSLRLFTPRGGHAPPSAASSAESSSIASAPVTHVYSMLSKFKMTEPHPSTLEMRFEGKSAADGGCGGLAPLRSFGGHGGPCSVLSCLVLQPCPASDVRSAVLKMMTRVHMEREFRSGSEPVPTASNTEKAHAEGSLLSKGAPDKPLVGRDTQQPTIKVELDLSIAESKRSGLSDKAPHEVPHGLHPRKISAVLSPKSASTSSASACSSRAATSARPTLAIRSEDKLQNHVGKPGNRYLHSSSVSSCSGGDCGATSSRSTGASVSASREQRSAARERREPLRRSKKGSIVAEQDDSAGVFFGGGVFTLGDKAKSGSAAESFIVPHATIQGACQEFSGGSTDDTVELGSPTSSLGQEGSPKAPSPCRLPIPALALGSLQSLSPAPGMDDSLLQAGRFTSPWQNSTTAYREPLATGLATTRDRTANGALRPPLGLRSPSAWQDNPVDFNSNSTAQERTPELAAATECFKSIAAAAAVLVTDDHNSDIRIRRFSSLRRRQSLIPSYTDAKYARSQSAPRPRLRPLGDAMTIGTKSPLVQRKYTTNQCEASPILKFPPYNPEEPSPLLVGPFDDSTAQRLRSLHSHPVQPTPTSSASKQPEEATPASRVWHPVQGKDKPLALTPPETCNTDCLLDLDGQESPKTPGSWLKRARALSVPL